MEQLPSNAEAFTHVRVFLGIVTGLSVSRILIGLAKFVQDPRHAPIYLPHLLWSGFLILLVMVLWWADLSYRSVGTWNFDLFAFILAFSATHFFLCVLIFPDNMAAWTTYEEYFHARRSWFFTILAALMLLDIADTLQKGDIYFRHLGGIYPWRQAALALVFLLSVKIENRTYHFWLPILVIAQEIFWISSRYVILR